MSIDYPPLSMDDDGNVSIQAGDDFETLGHITNGCDVPECSRQWAWPLAEWRDGQNFAVGCRAAAEAAYNARFGDVSRWR